MADNHDDVLEADKRRRQLLEERIRQGRLNRERKDWLKDNKNRRDQEAKEDKKRSHAKILTTAEIKQLQESLDVAAVLTLTYGNRGGTFDLSHADLKAFADNIELLADRYNGGITAKQVIDASLPIDIQRANQEIPTVAPVSQKNGVIHFITAASGKNGATNHHVNVEFISFSALQNGAGYDAAIAKKLLNFGKLRFECDCGRHTYWYRYLASVGRYGFGEQENAYPKIRNPQLKGLACKHVLRVMDYIRSPLGIHYVFKMLEKARNSKVNKRHTESAKQVIEAIDNNTRDIKADHQAAFNALQRHAEKKAKEYFKDQRRQLKALEKSLAAIVAHEAKQLSERKQSLVNSMTAEETAAVEAYLKQLRGQK